MKQENRFNTYYTSDLHLGHKNILKFCENRKFDHLYDMEQTIVKRFNNTVKPEDTVIFVGDIFLGHSRDFQRMILARLNCARKILVLGNHDKSASQMMNIGFDFACHEMVRYIQGERVVISHYPYAPKVTKGLEKHDLRYLDRRPIDNGGFLLHGHTHSTEQVNGRSIHVGIDAWNMMPVSENKIASIINNIKKGENNG